MARVHFEHEADDQARHQTDHCGQVAIHVLNHRRATGDNNAAILYGDGSSTSATATPPLPHTP
jgi:hypothetical protein